MILGLSVDKLHYLTKDLNECEVLLDMPIQRDASFIFLALAKRHTPECYQLIKKYLEYPDSYRRCQAINFLLYFSEEREQNVLVLENMLKDFSDSNNASRVRTILSVAHAHKVYMNEETLFSVAAKHLPALDAYDLGALQYTQYTPENIERIISLFESSKKRRQREVLAKLLADRTDEEHFEKVFELLATDEYHKVQYYASLLATVFKRRDLTERFLSDKNGHTRYLAYTMEKSIQEEIQQ